MLKYQEIIHRGVLALFVEFYPIFVELFPYLLDFTQE